jgi:hypothetical protein
MLKRLIIVLVVGGQNDAKNEPTAKQGNPWGNA